MVYQIYLKKAGKKKEKKSTSIKVVIMTDITFSLKEEHMKKTGRGQVALNSLYVTLPALKL